MTYSIVALKGKMLGIAVASGSIAVGSRVPWARFSVGAVVTQAYTNPSLGPLILNYLEKGFSAKEALAKALSKDPNPEKRQVAVLSCRGEIAYHNGSDIPREYGVYVGENCVCIGNLIVSSRILEAMCKTFEKKVDEDFTYALLLALTTAHRLGGDRRGDRSAAILVVSETPYGKLYDKVVDLRVDFSDNPVYELIELYEACKELA